MAVVVDETGCNTSMKNDGNGCNRKYVGRAGETPQLRASECDNHYTTMCFTALNGDPYVAGKSPDLAVEMGFDEFTFDNEEEFDDEDINPAQNNALRYMDKHNLFPREDGRIPFLLLDAHHSRYDLEFLVSTAPLISRSEIKRPISRPSTIVDGVSRSTVLFSTKTPS